MIFVPKIMEYVTQELSADDLCVYFSCYLNTDAGSLSGNMRQKGSGRLFHLYNSLKITMN